VALVQFDGDQKSTFKQSFGLKLTKVQKKLRFKQKIKSPTVGWVTGRASGP